MTAKPRVLWLYLAIVASLAAHAAGDLTRQTPTDILVRLGDEDGRMRFYPDTIRVETGKLYRLRLINRSPHPHYFSSENFARGIFTRKVESLAADGERQAEIKGQIREIEVFPGGVVE